MSTIMPDHIPSTERWLEAGTAKSGACQITNEYAVRMKPNWFSRVCKPASQSLCEVGEALNSAFKNYYRLNDKQQFALIFDAGVARYKSHRKAHEKQWLVILGENRIVHAIAASITFIFQKIFRIDWDLVAQLKHAPEIIDCTLRAIVSVRVFKKPDGESPQECPLWAMKPGFGDLEKTLLQRIIDQPEKRALLELFNSKNGGSYWQSLAPAPLSPKRRSEIQDFCWQIGDQLATYMQIALTDEILKMAASASDSDKQLLDSCPEIREWANSQIASKTDRQHLSATQDKLRSEIDADLSHLSSALKDNTPIISSECATAKDLKSEIAAVNAKMDAAEAKLGAIEAKHEAIKGELSAIKAEHYAISGESAIAKRRESRIADAYVKVDAVKAKLDAKSKTEQDTTAKS